MQRSHSCRHEKGVNSERANIGVLGLQVNADIAYAGMEVSAIFCWFGLGFYFKRTRRTCFEFTLGHFVRGRIDDHVVAKLML